MIMRCEGIKIVRWRKRMAKRDRDYENRMAGYISAYNMVKKEGI